MKKNAFAAKLAAATLALGLAAAPAVALARPAVPALGDAVVAQSSYDYGDSVLAAAADANYALSEIAITDLDTYVNAEGIYVDYVGFDAYGTHYDYEVDHFTCAIVDWTMYAL